MTDTQRPITVRKGNLWSERRTAAGLSLRQLSALTGINRGTLSRIEQGLPPTPAQAEKMAAATRKDSAA